MPDREVNRIRELVYEFRVSDMMKQDVITVTPDAEMGGLRALLRENRIAGVPVAEGGSPKALR